MLHMPTFSMNLVSLSAFVDQIDCRIILEKVVFLIHERSTGRSLGTGTRHRWLWYMKRNMTDQDGMGMLAVVAEDKETRDLILL